LTLGYARRFTAYKRPEMIFHDPIAWHAILNATRSARCRSCSRARRIPPTSRQTQPAARLQARARSEIRRPLAFIDDYDMHVAHYLVPGLRRVAQQPAQAARSERHQRHESVAQRRAALSIGDGWWAEGFNGRNGWLIDGQANPDDHAATDAADANALYELLENDVVPAFYDRDRGGRGLPRRWIAIVREAMRSNVPRFSTRRMVKQYVTEMYGPAARSTVNSPTENARDRFVVPFAPRLEDLRRGVVLLLGRSRASRAVSINFVIAPRRSCPPTPGTAPSCHDDRHVLHLGALTLSMVSRLVW
jgi:starch phosphorylase